VRNIGKDSEFLPIRRQIVVIFIRVTHFYIGMKLVDSYLFQVEIDIIDLLYNFLVNSKE